MKLENYQAEKFKKNIKKIIKDVALSKDFKVFIFGSRVNGSSEERSDIDLGISGKEKIDTLTKEKIEKKIDALPILYKVDLVDFFNVSDDFKKKALSRVEYII